MFINDLSFDLIAKKKSDIGKVLLYSDSRGTEIYPRFKHKNPYFSYIRGYLDSYSVEYELCPHKFTSLLDFLEYTSENQGYSHIILHCGIVDFAPRPLSSYTSMLKDKENYLKKMGWYHYFENRNDFLCDYEGEACLQFMSREFLINEFIPALEKIENIIYVGINPVVNDWRGNYWRDRPDCINEQLEQDLIMLRHFNDVVDLSAWSDEEVKYYTVDNVHYNRKGLNFIGERVSQILAKKSS